MPRINVNVYPKDGYFFTEADGTVLRATNGWKGVISRVISYRRRNKLPPGNPTDEVHAQACERNPDACRPDPDPVHKQALKVASLKGRVFAWGASLRARRASEPLPFVDAATMHARATVCAGCPAHAAISGGCGSCKRALKEVRQDLLGGRAIDERVSGCTALGEDCAVNAWLDQQTVENDELPGICWRRRSPPQ